MRIEDRDCPGRREPQVDEGEPVGPVERAFVGDHAGRPGFTEVPGTEKVWPADLVALAIGYTGPETNGMVDRLGLDLDTRGNLLTNGDYQTSKPGIFAAGDARRGQSLVVWAISEGREAARAVDAYLSGFIALPTKGEGDLPRV